MGRLSTDTVVVGAGVIGAAVAYELASAGVEVVILDDKPVGSGCTYHGSGLVWKLIWNEPLQYRFAKQATDALFAVVPRVHELSDIDPQLHRFDTVLPIFDDGDVVALERDIETSEGDIEVEWLDRDEVLAREPRINPEVRRGAFLAGSAQLDGYRLARSFAGAAEHHGASFLALRATGVERDGGRVTGVVHTGGRISCERVVICMGAWSGLATDWLGVPVPVTGLKGETIRMLHPETFPVKISRPSGGGAAPRVDGLVMVGSTGTNRFDDRPGGLIKLDLDFEPTVEGRTSMIEQSSWVVPCLADGQIVYHLAGPRPLSADGMPMIGAVPDLDGAYLATGHRNKGIHLSALTGRTIREMILGEASTVEREILARFDPARFNGQHDVRITAPGIAKDDLKRMI